MSRKNEQQAQALEAIFIAKDLFDRFVCDKSIIKTDYILREAADSISADIDGLYKSALEAFDE